MNVFFLLQFWEHFWSAGVLVIVLANEAYSIVVGWRRARNAFICPVVCLFCADEKEKYDPYSFRDAVVQGLNEAGRDTEQVTLNVFC